MDIVEEGISVPEDSSPTVSNIVLALRMGHKYVDYFDFLFFVFYFSYFQITKESFVLKVLLIDHKISYRFAMIHRYPFRRAVSIAEYAAYQNFENLFAIDEKMVIELTKYSFSILNVYFL